MANKRKISRISRISRNLLQMQTTALVLKFACIACNIDWVVFVYIAS